MGTERKLATILAMDVVDGQPDVRPGSDHKPIREHNRRGGGSSGQRCWWVQPQGFFEDSRAVRQTLEVIMLGQPVRPEHAEGPHWAPVPLQRSDAARRRQV